MNDTIAAIATALGVGAISIIKVSGSKAINIVNSVFSGDLKSKGSNTINYGYITYKKEKIDEVLVSVMRAPHTFTREDVVEINCHGGIATTNRILEVLLETGCRLAEPGEFTKRAYLNGRIDLIEAEAVMDLVKVKTEASRKIAMQNLEGKTTAMIRNIRQEILELLAAIEVNIDYPEYEDIEQMTREKIETKLRDIKANLEELYENSQNAQIIKDGIDVAIIGKPNVGKSSLLNSLLNQNKAIVTDIAGTTRDVVEGSINLDGVLLNILDTAGIRTTKDVIEEMGVHKSLKKADEADLIIAMFNNNEVFSADDQKVLDIIKSKKHLIIINKIDLPTKLDMEMFKNEKVIKTNIINGEGILNLKQEIKNMFNMGVLEQKDYNYLSNVRQITLVKQSLNSLNQALTNIKNKKEIDLIEIDIRDMWNALGQIIGEAYSEELLDQLFSQFCVGK